MAERLQKKIAQAGLMSRRAAEEAIRNGRVTLNGRIAELGATASPGDSVLIDGIPVPEKEKKAYYMLNKPRGYVCSLHDEEGRRSVRELLPRSAGRVYPVGRLDMMSEGLLLMTNDGNFAYRVMHPSGCLLKTYRTCVKGSRLQEQISRLREPFTLDDTEVRAVRVVVLKTTEETAVIDITIREGRNRQIRRMCEEAGLKVLRLTRIAEGSLRLGKLPCGKARELTQDEIASVLGEE